jgi:uncharacterized protein (TIGR03086 family)
MSDTIDRLQKSTGQTAKIVKEISPDQYQQATPCADWDVRAVVNHIIGAMTMMATVIDKGSVDAEKLFTSDLVGSDGSRSYDEAMQAALEAFGRPGVLEGTVNLPFGTFPAEFAAGLLTNDLLTHGWDLAKATDQNVDFDAQLTETCMAFCRQTFANPEIRANEFAPEVKVPDDAPAIDRLVGYLGRQP